LRVAKYLGSSGFYKEAAQIKKLAQVEDVMMDEGGPGVGLDTNVHQFIKQIASGIAADAMKDVFYVGAPKAPEGDAVFMHGGRAPFSSFNRDLAVRVGKPMEIYVSNDEVRIVFPVVFMDEMTQNMDADPSKEGRGSINRATSSTTLELIGRYSGGAIDTSQELHGFGNGRYGDPFIHTKSNKTENHPGWQEIADALAGGMPTAPDMQGPTID
jgi:hypothetical protein